MKFVVYFSLALSGIAACLYFYIFREREIDVGLIPKEFSYCGMQIYGNEKEYQEIVSWLKNNKEGWVLTYVSYVPKQVYRNPAFVVNVMSGGVVVSYKTDYGYPQYVKTTEHDLSLSCVTNS